MSKTDPSYSRIPADAANRWAVVRLVCSGPDAVKTGNFLPYLNAQDKSLENQERNEDYRERAVFYSVTGRTRDGLLGLAFKRDPDVSEIPARLDYLMQNADGCGISLYQQSQSAVLSVLETGRHGLLVDYSDALSAPVIKAYQAEDIINWRTEIVGGAKVLTLLVLHEIHEQADGYETAAQDQWREYELTGGAVVVRLWRKTSAGTALVPDAAGNTETILSTGRGRMQRIPFCFIGAQNNDESIDEAPLFDLAHLNVAHYRNSADYEDSVWFAGQAQPWISGLTEEWRDHLEGSGKQYIGSRSPFLLPQGGSFGFAQVQPNTLAKEAMDQKEHQMAALGAQLLENSKAAKTATQDDNEKEATTSVLSMVVANVSEAYARAFEFCGEFIGQVFSPRAEYRINQDFTRMTADPQVIAAIVDSWAKGIYAKQDARAYLRRMNVIPADRTDEEIDSDLEQEGPAHGAMDEMSANGISQREAV